MTKYCQYLFFQITAMDSTALELDSQLMNKTLKSVHRQTQGAKFPVIGEVLTGFSSIPFSHEASKLLTVSQLTKKIGLSASK